MYRTKAIYQLSDLKQSSWKILRLFEIYRQSGSQAPVHIILTERLFLDNMDVWHFLRKKHKNQPHETGGDNGETNEDKCTVVQTTTKTKTNSMVQ